MLQNAYLFAKSMPTQPKTSNILPKFEVEAEDVADGRRLDDPAVRVGRLEPRRKLQHLACT